MEVTSSKTVLLLNGKQIGACCDLELPPRLSEPEPLCFSGSASFTYHIPPGKKARRFARQIHELSMGWVGRKYARHYRAVKHHQLRKRLINKRR